MRCALLSGVTRVGDLELPLPDDWEDRSLYSFVAPPAKTVPMRATHSTFRKNVVLQKRKLPGEATLDTCVEELVELTREGHGDLAVDVRDGPRNDTLTSKCVSYRLVDPVTNQPVAQLIYVCLVDGAEWQMAVSVPAFELDEARRQFDAILAQARRVGRMS